MKIAWAICGRLVLAAATAWPGIVSGAPDLAGRYTVASLPAKADATLAEATYGGVLDIVSKPRVYAVTWRLTAETRRLRGLALLEDNDLLGVSLATGGIAHGLAIYHHATDSRQWRGRWITSIDSGATPGEISFDDGGSDKLPGKHPFHCSRPGVGGFDGTVTITAAGADYLLTFAADGAQLYRGAGILLDDGRFVVGWSYGSPPALAVYHIGSDGLFAGRRLSVRNGQPTVVSEDLAKSGDDAARLFPPAARIDPALGPPDVDASIEPDAPEVKSWIYADLMNRYGPDGWAERWLDGQLTPEEHALLERAVHRRPRRGSAANATSRQTIGALIEQERNRSED